MIGGSVCRWRLWQFSLCHSAGHPREIGWPQALCVESVGTWMCGGSCGVWVYVESMGVWVCGGACGECGYVDVGRDESIHKFPNYTFTFLHAPPPTTPTSFPHPPTSLPHPPPPHNSPRASSGHAWNQSMVQQLMREGNLRRRLRKASPMGLKARMTWRFSLHRLTKKLKRDSGVCSASLFSACASGRIA